jgi:RNA polymerase sigma-70 factor (ECF subfamily)
MIKRDPGPASLEDLPAAMLYERYAMTIMGYLRRRLPSREDAEDLLMEVFMAAFERNSLVGLSEDERAAWLHQVARNKMIDFYRRAGRRSSVGLDEVDNVLYDETVEVDPERVSLRHEEEHRLHLAFQQIPAATQEILRLRFVNGLRSTQIAGMLGKREGTVRMTISRALNLLRSLYVDTSEER